MGRLKTNQHSFPFLMKGQQKNNSDVPDLISIYYAHYLKSVSYLHNYKNKKWPIQFLQYQNYDFS